ncbi:thioredoxin reductase [Paenibacillus phyllosphaerae]|uniref:Thioredoxin reductase n=1 Tax=Paenibacillus phyllosphaerae TaxID=274593 RepID=A0A7W5AZP3_9BACL|nr:NAD(P)/FAD-dependent oxidoreductase [Paenibacillus phyllosphaerae]MBB3111226.1 thioredoxin reductase [Paenibacillus phyllosphaerae]
MRYDCAIVGGGPAGLNAALVLGRSRRGTILLDNNKPRNAVTHASHGFLTRDGVRPADFRRMAQEEIRGYPSVVTKECEITHIARLTDGFLVSTAQGEYVQASKIILATGLKESFPDIPGFTELYGRSLFNCPYCDGYEMQDQPIVLVSEGASAYHTAKLLLNWSRNLVVCTNWHANLSPDQQQQLYRQGVQVNMMPIDAFVGSEGQLAGVRFKDGSFIQRSGGFVTPRLSQRSDFGEQLGCARTEFGGIVTDSYGRTSVPGVYAAGDSALVMPSQLIIAAAEGSRAAMGVNSDLIEEWFYR